MSRKSKRHAKVRYVQDRGDESDPDEGEDDDDIGEDEDDIDGGHHGGHKNGRVRRRREAARIAMPYTV